ncbi:MAG: trypsin-like peptidase domain-containing protein [Patescibacteria group bacterium]
MESLNKQQLILLALLVSFVTSIATGIVTVSLMEQAPPAMTQTINRVVEKTIERVVMEPAKQSAAVVTKETIVVKADDAVIEAIEKNHKSVVRVKEVTSIEGVRRENFAGLALILTKEGHLAADLSVAYRRSDEAGNAVAESYIGVFPDGKVFPLNIVYSDQASGLMVFQPFLQDREKGAYKFTPPSFSAASLKLGQAVIAIGGEETNAVSTGIIANLVERQAEGTVPGEKALLAIRTDIRSSELVLGGVLLNLFGEVIGQNAGKGLTSRSSFLPIGAVLALLEKVPKE